jgi:hypothetical protein
MLRSPSALLSLSFRLPCHPVPSTHSPTRPPVCPSTRPPVCPSTPPVRPPVRWTVFRGTVQQRLLRPKDTAGHSAGQFAGQSSGALSSRGCYDQRTPLDTSPRLAYIIYIRGGGRGGRASGRRSEGDLSIVFQLLSQAVCHLDVQSFREPFAASSHRVCTHFLFLHQ